jgi:hypothetical protein
MLYVWRFIKSAMLVRPRGRKGLRGFAGFDRVFHNDVYRFAGMKGKRLKVLRRQRALPLPGSFKGFAVLIDNTEVWTAFEERVVLQICTLPLCVPCC